MSGLREALARVAGGPTVFVGTGGTMAAAVCAARLHERISGQPARVATPLEFASLPPVISWGVVLFSSSLRHPDALAVVDRMASGRFRPAVVVTLRPQESAEDVVSPGVEVVSLPPLIMSEGFLATSSVLSMVVALARAYEGDEFLPAALPWPDVNQPELASRVLVLRPSELAWVAIDIEVRCHELGLAAVQVTDYRNFAHGRHVGLSRHAATTTVLGLVSTDSERLAQATLAVLPSEIAEVVSWHPKHDGIAGGIELLVASMQLAGRAADKQHVNAARPGAPDFGRRLYHLGIRRLLPAALDGPVLRKVRSLGAAIDSPVAAAVERSYVGWAQQLNELAFSGLVLDYDGTMCFTRRRFELPPARVQHQFCRLLEGGMIIGVASGRGKSLYAALKEWVPPQFWSQMIVGLYNGGVLTGLGDELPDCSVPSALMTEVVQRLRQLPVADDLEIEPRSVQVTVAPRRGSFVRAGRLNDLVVDVLSREPALAVRTVVSGHSIDVVPVESTKRTVVDLVTSACRGPVIAIGDQGDVGGNDHELLASVTSSLTVDECSPDLSRCWYLDSKGRGGPDLLATYLAALEPYNGGFQLRWRQK